MYKNIIYKMLIYSCANESSKRINSRKKSQSIKNIKTSKFYLLNYIIILFIIKFLLLLNYK